MFRNGPIWPDMAHWMEFRLEFRLDMDMDMNTDMMNELMNEWESRRGAH